ncbi:prolipoprotein diacylglyceryl transferase family protein [Pseudonocardia broussonetiae]|uniref:Diacylglyceryl transferase n=1 Tax=Pseudonocardia broussonetiae TaxID=2736640 RepID=A0A6M6JLA6_9PSEU|nr:prolipoprotein diacylglyceryl transferase family protein [Pseudonocardia broussonetiae]QJY47850.1 diacylglyceryl transferase [Pseudonocardia broussonetiae]
MTAAPVARQGAVPTAEAVTAGGCAEKLADDLGGDQVGLTATYWLEPHEHVRTTSEPVTIRFVGQRVGATGQDPRDRFDRTEQVEGLPPDSGRVSITTKVVGVNAGQWQVVAAPVAGVTGATDSRPGPPVRRVTTRTRPAPLLHGPGVRETAWPALVLLGVLVALVTQALLLQQSVGAWAGAMTVSVVAVAVGYLAAKLWYLALHRQSLRKFIPAGTCIQGFLLGGFGTLAVGSLVTGAPVGLLLDATAPGVFLAMAIGRPGCFLGGCCVGRPTSSRWGLWSSDRRIGVRRIPVQLLEAVMALAIGTGTLALFLAGPLPLPGALFVGAVTAYTVGRQLLFPLRREPRRTSAGRLLTLAAAGLVVVAAVLAPVLTP